MIIGILIKPFLLTSATDWSFVFGYELYQLIWLIIYSNGSRNYTCRWNIDKWLIWHYIYIHELWKTDIDSVFRSTTTSSHSTHSPKTSKKQTNKKKAPLPFLLLINSLQRPHKNLKWVTIKKDIKFEEKFRKFSNNFSLSLAPPSVNLKKVP